MKKSKVFFGSLLFAAILVAGCSAPLHQSLLLQENRRLEDALYTVHAQVADLKRENNLLRRQQTINFSNPVNQEPWDDSFDMDAPYEMPKITLPGESSTTEMPESLRESQTFPIWTPVR